VRLAVVVKEEVREDVMVIDGVTVGVIVLEGVIVMEGVIVLEGVIVMEGVIVLEGVTVGVTVCVTVGVTEADQLRLTKNNPANRNLLQRFIL